MKQVYLAVLLIFCAFLCFSQSPGSPITIKGSVIDSVSQTPLAFVTIALSRRSDMRVVQSTHTDSEGKFELSQLSSGNYILSLSLVGYKPLKLTVATQAPATSNAINLGKVNLAPALNGLQAVSINGFKPLVNQQADRLTYDVQADPESKVNNALDMLRKVPLVSVDGADNIRLKGGSNYRMLINGKTSSLISSNPSDILKAMPADNIEKIEVITTPPSRYDAEGVSGIINIITQRKLSEGYSVNLTTTYNTVNGPSANINAKAKQGKFGIQGFVGTAHPVEQTISTGYSNMSFAPQQAQIVQNGTMVHDRNNSFGSAELSFEADSLNLFTAEIEHHGGRTTQQTQQMYGSFLPPMQLNQSYELQNATRNKIRGTDIGFNHEHAFRRTKGHLLTSSYKYSYSSDAFTNTAHYVNAQNYTAPDYLQHNRSGSKEHTGQVDYIRPFKFLQVELGAKFILRNNFSEFDSQNFNREEGVYRPDQNLSNVFDYQQNIYSLYNSYHLNWKDWDARAGLRWEKSDVDADFRSSGTEVDQRYTNFFPSLSLQRMLNSSNSLSLGYQERLERPGILLLNPFEDATVPGFLSTGNPALEAVINHSVDLVYNNSSKMPFTLGLSYAYANNTIESITEVGADQISRTSFRNVGKRKSLSMIFNANFSVSPNLNTNIDAQLMHVDLNGSLEGQMFNSDGLQWHLFSNTRYRFEKGYRIGADVSYDSRYVLLQGRDNDFLYYSLNASKDFLGDKLTVSASSSNFFNKFNRLDFTTRGRDFSQKRFYDIYYRRFNVRMVYKFGRLHGEIKKNRRGILNDDQSSGRSNPS